MSVSYRAIYAPVREIVCYCWSRGYILISPSLTVIVSLDSHSFFFLLFFKNIFLSYFVIFILDSSTNLNIHGEIR